MKKEIAKREQCPGCAASGRDTDKDNLAIYADGKYCQAGCGYMENNKVEHRTVNPNLIPGIVTPITERGLTEELCTKYNVRTSEYTGRLAGSTLNKEQVIILPIYEHGRVVKQKIRHRTIKKIMSQVGQTDSMRLFGQNCFNPSGSIPIIVTEGEFDAMSMYQMCGLPSVSITRGAQGAYRELSENIEWLSSFKEVLLCFDMDEAGVLAANECIPLFEPGKIKRINLPLKDANEMLLADRQSEIKKLIWNAETVRPKTIVFPNDIREQVLEKAKFGTPWPWEFMTKVTYGNRLGEVYMLAGDTGVGKTQIMYQVISHHIANGQKVGLIDLERQNVQTLQRVISGMLNKRIYLPDCDDFNVTEIAEKLDELQDSLALYRPESGKLSMESILINIRYLA